jgi:Uma2 family endonuclease
MESIMAITTRRLTYDDLERIPQEREGDRHELIDGELVASPSSVPVHQIIVRNLTIQLGLHIESGNLGTLIPSPIDVKFSPHNVLNPDLIVIAGNRPDAIGEKAILAAPDLVVEILSPGTRRRDLNAKREIYARFRVREYWIVDPNARSVRALTLTGDRYVEIPVGADSTIRSVVLPGLELALEAVFRGV